MTRSFNTHTGRFFIIPDRNRPALGYLFIQEPGSPLHKLAGPTPREELHQLVIERRTGFPPWDDALATTEEAGIADPDNWTSRRSFVSATPDRLLAS
jgi:hypothetical protein